METRKGFGASKRRSIVHYRRMAEIAHANLPPQDVRFWRMVIKAKGCWSWHGATTDFGYGVFRWNGKNAIASRIAWELTNGPIPKGLRVLHKCDNPPCCNPKHLFLGTMKDNTDDMIKKGRTNWAKGERQASSKLTTSQVLEIRKTSGMSHPQVARRYGVSASAISAIKNGWTWTHI